MSLPLLNNVFGIVLNRDTGTNLYGGEHSAQSPSTLSRVKYGWDEGLSL
jgi:hypothetical protein